MNGTTIILTVKKMYNLIVDKKYYLFMFRVEMSYNWYMLCVSYYVGNLPKRGMAGEMVCIVRNYQLTRNWSKLGVFLYKVGL